MIYLFLQKTNVDKSVGEDTSVSDSRGKHMAASSSVSVSGHDESPWQQSIMFLLTYCYTMQQLPNVYLHEMIEYDRLWLSVTCETM